MIDIENLIKALKVSWIKRVIEADNDSILNRIYIYNLRAFGGNLLFECNIFENDIGKFTQNIFLKDDLSAWCKCTANAVISSYRHEILWNNSHIKVGANTIMFAIWYHNGIKFFKDKRGVIRKFPENCCHFYIVRPIELELQHIILQHICS